MIATEFNKRFHIWILIGAVLLLGLAFRLPTIALGVVGALFFTFVTIKLLSLKRNTWWTLWLATLFISAFGPFLDIITGMPINWLIGLLVLYFFVITQFRRLFTPIPNAQSSNNTKALMPIIGVSLLFYIFYFFFRILASGEQFWNGLMALRIPITGLAGYFLTVYGFHGNMTREEVLDRLKQFLTIFIIMGTVVSFYGIFQYVVGYENLQSWGLTEASGRYLHNQRNLLGGTTIFRIFGTMRRNETLGVFLYINIVVCIAAIRFGLYPRRRIWISLSLSIVAMVLALSLTSIVTLGLWVIAALLISRSKRLKTTALALGLFGIFSLFIANLLLGGLIGLRFAEHVLDTEQEVGRVQMFINWAEEIAERPIEQVLFGTGVCTGLDEGSFDRISGILNSIGIRVSGEIECGWNRVIKDNWYATHSLEIGLVGLLLFWINFVVIVFVLLPIIQSRWKSSERAGWELLVLGILALWPSGFIGALIMYMPITLYFWSIVGLLEVGARYPRLTQKTTLQS